MKSFSQLKSNLKKNPSALKPVKVAILGDTATQFLAQAIKGAGYEYGFNLQLWEADYNLIEQEILDPNSELYNYKPEIVIVFQSSHKLLCKYNKLHPDLQSTLSVNELKSISAAYSKVTNQINSKFIFYNYPEIDDAILGNYANKTDSSFLFQLRKLNYELMLFASNNANFFLCDLSGIQNLLGKQACFQPSIYINTDMVLSIDVLPYIAFKTLDIIGAMNGKMNKCLVLDLDNTLWGGIIGDDGLEKIQLGGLGIGKAFTEFQYWIKKLKNRGIILAICSKNNEEVAKEPFEKHPDMVLKMEDISVFIANWENKADNIRQIKEILNIGFDSMVFIDDNPFEREFVRNSIPEINIPELPEDPADYLEYLYSLNLFETITYSKEDLERAKFYQVEAHRNLVQQKFSNQEEFLKSLNMLSKIEPFNEYNIPRVAQLSQRSNQFNLRTVRYTETDIKQLSISPDYFTFAFTLEDKFGDNGLICVIIMRQESEKQLFIESWFMSCRVLKRGMENFVLNTLARFASEQGYSYIKGEYIATPKNGMVKDHYSNLGFRQEENYWILSLEDYITKECYIKAK